MTYSIKIISRLLTAGVIGLTAVLAGCGSGGAGGLSDQPTITLTLESASGGAEKSPVTSSEPAKVIIKTSSDELVTLKTTVGTLSKASVTPVNGRAEVLLSVTLDDVNDGEVTATQANGATKTLAFSVGATQLQIGRIDANNFVNGQLFVGQTLLSPGGTTEIKAVIWKTGANILYDSPINVTFTSSCISSGKSTISTPILVTSGIANTTYKAINCQGTDVITATINVGGSGRSATGNVTFPATVSNSIEYVVPETPQWIYLTGVGNSQTEVKFKVLDSVGSPISNVMVDFALNTTVGGLALTAVSNQTDAQGLVSTFVTPGSIPTAVRVTAKVRGTAISTQSNQLSVTTGLPAQDRISVAVEKHAVEAYEYDGVPVLVTAFLADRYGNPSPDGTAVTFRTEVNGGAIYPASCTTVDGTCQVTWRSQGQRADPHRVTILATALGEESFTDTNGNGRYDAGEPIVDMPEAFVDANENGVRDSIEEFVDFNSNGTFDVADSLFSGALCNSGCAGNSMHVRASNLIIMSSSTPGALNGNPSSLDLRNEQVRNSSFTLKDQYGQPMPAGTTVTCSTNVGALQMPNSFTVSDTTSAAGYGFSCAVKGTVSPKLGEICTVTTGTLRVEVTTPRGLTTFFSPVSVTDNAKCEAPKSLGISPSFLPNGKKGTSYTSILLSASEGAAPYTWTATGLPSGMSVDANTGLLKGTPTADGTFAVTLNVSDKNGLTGSKVLLLTIDP